ncbi:MAG: hypothetical protein HONBIEJF_02742 [Fimbriimonadaceae bacterium]|nr:hypothetical protein [Fimbriimonadaceae bacterium]
MTPSASQKSWWDERWKAVAWGILLLALAIRLVGIGWGLSTELSAYGFHPDEWVIWAMAQRLDPLGLDFDPNFYNYGTLYLVWVKLLTAAGVSTVQDPAQAAAMITSSFLGPRLVSAVAGASIPALAWVALRERVGLWGAGAAAVALAVAPGLVVHSRFMTVDMSAAALLFAGLTVGMSIPTAPKPAQRAIACGLLIGLGAGTKFAGILGVLAIPFLAWPLAPEFRWKVIGMGLGATFVGFVLGTPGMLLNPEAFWRDFQYEMAHTSTGHGLVFYGTSPGFIYHAANLFEGLGTVITLFGLVGLVWAARNRSPWAVGLLVFAFAYFVLIGRAEVKFLRYTFPLMPCLALGFGVVVQKARETPHWSGKLTMAICILGLGGFFGGGAAGAARRTLEMNSEDPRDVAGRFLIGKTGQSVGFVADPWFYSPSVYRLVQAPRMVPFEVRETWREAAQPPVLRFLPADPNQRYDWDVRLIDELRPDRIAFSTFESDDLARISQLNGLPGEYQVQVDRYLAFWKRLQAEYDLEITFGGGSQVHDMMYIRPKIWIWKLKTTSANPSSGSSTTSATSGGAPR